MKELVSKESITSGESLLQEINLLKKEVQRESGDSPQQTEKYASYPERINKFNEGYDGLSKKEKAFLGVVAREIKKDGRNAYKEEIDGKKTHEIAQQQILSLNPLLAKDNYSLSISSAYRSPQQQFNIFFENKALTLSNQVVAAIPYFIPPEILNDQGGYLPGYEKQYAELLKSYKQRAQYVAPPGYSEHQTGKAFDIKIKGYFEGEEREVMLGNTTLLPGDIHQNVFLLLQKKGFRQTYLWESRHRYYTQ